MRKIRITLIGALLLLVVCQNAFARRVNRQITITAGTPTRLSIVHQVVNRIFIQPQAAAAGGVIYIMDGIPEGTTPSSSTAAHVTAVLCAATATAPGCSYADPPNGGGNSQTGLPDLFYVWVDGSHSTDVLVVSYDVRE